MEQTIEYSPQRLVEIMETYGDFTPAFSSKKEVNRLGTEEYIVYVALGQSLDVLGYDDLYYDSLSKQYFIFFSTFVEHLNKATNRVHSFNISLIFRSRTLNKLSFEMG